MNFKYNLDRIASAANYLDNIIDSSIICFEGQMGAGKTTLISSLCKKWEIKEIVSSPTFSIVNKYESNIKGNIYHFDFYRLNNIEEILDIGFQDYLDSGSICLIEWGVRIKSFLPKNMNVIKIAIDQNNFRTITIN